MVKLLNIEWLKVKAYRTFWILTGLFVVAVPLMTWAFESILNKSPKMVTEFLGAFVFPQVYDSTAWFASIATPIVGIMLIILLTNENNFRTIRQNIIDGLSRNQYVQAKFGVLLLSTVFVTLVITITALFFGLKNGTGNVTEGMIFIWYAFIQSLTYLSLAFFLGVYMKRSGIAIGLYVMYVYVGEFALSGILDYQVKYHLGSILPLESSDRLVPGIFSKIKKFVNQGGPGPTELQYLLMSCGYILLFNFLSWRKMEKSDL